MAGNNRLTKSHHPMSTIQTETLYKKVAEEVSETPAEPADPSDKKYGTFTWTFYRLATIKGYMTIKFYGSSNGYYSESVDFYRE